MRITYNWQGFHASRHVDDRLARLRRVLRAARQTSRYLPALERAGLDSRHAIGRVASIEDALRRLPPIDPDELRNAPMAFWNRKGLAAAKGNFLYPVDPRPRTAVIMPQASGPGFAKSSGLRLLGVNWRRKLARSGVAAIAAPVDMLREMSAAIKNGELTIGPLTNAVIAFTGVNLGELTGQDRELFWDVFQVPVFEQYLGFDGRLVAWECEAHDGLHVQSNEAVIEESDGAGSELLMTSLTNLTYPAIRLATRLYGTLASGPCECGRNTEKLYMLCPAGAAVYEEWAVA